ncbi:hypothetical protein SDJN02_24393, partial [Cucurbita argyrosperma subsp. argyrosperma]
MAGLGFSAKDGSDAVVFLLGCYYRSTLRLQERKEQAGHLYLDGFDLHSSQSDDPSRLELVEADTVASPSAILDTGTIAGSELHRRR